MVLCNTVCWPNVHEDILVIGTTAALLFAARMGPSAVSWSGGSAPANREDTVAIITAGGLGSSITMQWSLLRPSEMLSTVSAGEVRPFISKSASSLLSSSSVGIPWLSWMGSSGKFWQMRVGFMVSSGPRSAKRLE